jgi:hypothetical protein
MELIEYKNTLQQDCVSFVQEDGSIWSGLKSTYDAMQAQQSTPILTDEPAAKK